MNIKDAIEELCDQSYPVSCEEVKENCQIEFEMPTGESRKLEEVISCGQTPDEFQNEEELFNYVFSLAPEGAIGRKYYDDRSSSIETDRKQQSF